MGFEIFKSPPLGIVGMKMEKGVWACLNGYYFSSEMECTRWLELGCMRSTLLCNIFMFKMLVRQEFLFSIKRG